VVCPAGPEACRLYAASERENDAEEPGDCGAAAVEALPAAVLVVEHPPYPLKENGDDLGIRFLRHAYSPAERRS
jgi:hypothetical protein